MEIKLIIKLYKWPIKMIIGAISRIEEDNNQFSLPKNKLFMLILGQVSLSKGLNSYSGLG